MKIMKTVREIGLFEEAINLSEVLGSNGIAEKVGAEMPLPSTDIREDVKEIASWLLAFNKKRYVFLTPEIALIEEMANQTDRSIEAIIIAPSDMDDESRERINNNMPRFDSVLVTIIEEYSFGMIYPSEAMFVTCGYECGGRMIVMTDTERLVQRNACFNGKIAFIPYVSISMYYRCNGWIEVRTSKMTDRWRA